MSPSCGGKERVVVEQHRVGGGLDEVLDLLFALGGIRDGDPLVARVDRLHGGAAVAVDQALALEAGHVLVEAQVDQDLDALARPVGGNRAAQAEPGGSPGRAPDGADLVAGVFQAECLGRSDRLAGKLVPVDLQRGGNRVDGRADTFFEDSLDASEGQGDVVMHECLSPGCGPDAGVGALVCQEKSWHGWPDGPPLSWRWRP